MVIVVVIVAVIVAVVMVVVVVVVDVSHLQSLCKLQWSWLFLQWQSSLQLWQLFDEVSSPQLQSLLLQFFSVMVIVAVAVVIDAVISQNFSHCCSCYCSCGSCFCCPHLWLLLQLCQSFVS